MMKPLQLQWWLHQGRELVTTDFLLSWWERFPRPAIVWAARSTQWLVIRGYKKWMFKPRKQNPKTVNQLWERKQEYVFPRCAWRHDLERVGNPLQCSSLHTCMQAGQLVQERQWIPDLLWERMHCFLICRDNIRYWLWAMWRDQEE